MGSLSQRRLIGLGDSVAAGELRALVEAVSSGARADVVAVAG